MSTETIKKLKLYKLLSLVFFLTTIATVLIYTVTASKNKERQQEDLVSMDEHNKLSEDFNIAQEILKLDQELLANGNHQNTLRNFQALATSVENKNLNDLLKNRIAFTENLINSQNENQFSELDLQNKLQIKNKVIDSLENISDSLRGSFLVYKKNVERKTDSLLASSRKKEMQLSRKETVRVITFKNSSGNLIHYLGETEGDKAKGNGVGIWNTGSIYRGEWLNNKRHGNGEFSWSDGQKYSGEFVDDVRTGKGIYYWPSGERYEGEFLNNKRHGNGVFYDPDGNIKFNGAWKNDKFSAS
jgi:antitoxin component YwqK of YwqJK toxin-antitoxin module